MSKTLRVAAVSEGGGGSGLCQPYPCIVINGPSSTPNPKGMEALVALLAQLAQLASTSSEIELDVESLIKAAEWLEREQRAEDALTLAAFCAQTADVATAFETKERALNILMRCNHALGRTDAWRDILEQKEGLIRQFREAQAIQ